MNVAILLHGTDIIGIDILVCAKLFKNQIALGILADSAQSIQGHFRIEFSKVNNNIANRAAGGAGDAIQNVNQLTLLGPTHSRIDNIYDHITCNTNTFTHDFTPVCYFSDFILTQSDSNFNRSYTHFGKILGCSH